MSIIPYGQVPASSLRNIPWSFSSLGFSLCRGPKRERMSFTEGWRFSSAKLSAPRPAYNMKLLLVPSRTWGNVLASVHQTRRKRVILYLYSLINQPCWGHLVPSVLPPRFFLNFLHPFLSKTTFYYSVVPFDDFLSSISFSYSSFVRCPSRIFSVSFGRTTARYPSVSGWR